MPDYLIDDAVKDLIANDLKNNVDKIVLCTQAPANYTDANTLNGVSTGNKLAEKTVTSTDFTVDNAATDGRKCEATAQSQVNVDAAGTGTHIAWLDTTGTTIKAITKLATARGPLAVNDKVDWPAHAAIIRDAVAAS